jgi:hypothetical protein
MTNRKQKSKEDFQDAQNREGNGLWINKKRRKQEEKKCQCHGILRLDELASFNWYSGHVVGTVDSCTGKLAALLLW